MSLLSRFRRNRVEEETTTLPEPSVYDTPPNERPWMAWILSFVTLLVTVLVVIGLFYGGRWLYRKATHKPAKVATTQNQPESTPEESKDTTSDSDQSNDTSSSDANSSSSSNNSSSTPQTGTSSTSTSTPSTSSGSNTSSTAAGKGSSSNLPNTGPGDMVSIFVAISLLGYLTHRYLVAKSN